MRAVDGFYDDDGGALPATPDAANKVSAFNHSASTTASMPCISSLPAYVMKGWQSAGTCSWQGCAGGGRVEDQI